MSTSPPLWKASVPASKTEAPDLTAAFELMVPAPQAVLISEEPFEDKAVVEALFAEAPDGALLSQLAGRPVNVAQLPDTDWIKLSQQGLPPVRAGRFFVFGKHDAGKVPDGVIPMRIEAGLAFGTGHHETTALCLGVLSDLARRRRYQNVLDLGCGTALLAIGAAKLWRRNVLATDIDPDAIMVANENAAVNGVRPLITARVADGLTHPAITARAPFDLVVANILAGPLTHMAPALAHAVARGGTLVLSGLLEWQENLVLSFYRPHGLRLVTIRREHHWSALILERPRRRG
jgi:ribosomal protein L11 methyltransferase